MTSHEYYEDFCESNAWTQDDDAFMVKCFLPTVQFACFFINWRPITMLNIAYKIYAKALALRLTDHLKDWIRHEQKGFIKGSYILDAIIALWEGAEYEKESG